MIIKTNPNINYDLKHEAFPYQTQAFLTLKDLDYSAIFHEQGLGKTKIAIDILVYWLTQKNIDTVLVVTKKQLVNNWKEEFSEHTFLRPRILTTNKKDNYYIFNSPARIIITNFETVVSELTRMKLFLKSRNVGIIIDESTKLKNPDAKVTKAFFELSPIFKKKMILTGTPIANRPYDVWAQIFFLDEGKSLGTDFNTFKKENDLSNKLSENVSERIAFEENVASIFERISSFSVRETKHSAGLVLPEKTIITEYAEFEETQKRIYESVIRDLSVEITKNEQVIIDDDTSALKRLLRLVQVASNPKLIDDQYSYTSGKEVVLKRLIEQIILRGEKCIIWSIYVGNTEQFYEEYKKYNPAIIHGGKTIEQRNAAVKKFKEDDSCKLLFATPQSAKEGLTLTIANNVIFYDRGFNLDDYLQAQDRIHRISQNKACFVYNIQMKDSIDDWVASLLDAKQYAAFLAQGDISLDAYRKTINYSYAEIVEEILNEGKDL